MAERRNLIVATALVEDNCGKSQSRNFSRNVEQAVHGSGAYRPTLSTAVRLLTTSSIGNSRQGTISRLAAANTLLGESFRPISSRPTAVPESCIKLPHLVKLTMTVLLEQQAHFTEGTGPHLINAVAPDGKFTDEAPRITAAATGSKTATRTSSAT